MLRCSFKLSNLSWLAYLLILVVDRYAITNRTLYSPLTSEQLIKQPYRLIIKLNRYLKVLELQAASKCLGFLGCDHPVHKVLLVSDEIDNDILVGFLPKLVNPALDHPEAGAIGDIVHQDCAIGVSVVDRRH